MNSSAQEEYQLLDNSFASRRRTNTIDSFASRTPRKNVSSALGQRTNSSMLRRQRTNSLMRTNSSMKAKSSTDPSKRRTDFY